MRALAALLLLACAAHAGEVLVRVTFGDDPIEGAGVQAIAADDDVVFDAVAWKPAALTDETGEAVVDVPQGGRVLVAMPGYALAVVPADAATIDVMLRPEHVFTGTVTDAEGKPVGGAHVKLSTQFKETATFPTQTDARGRFAVFGLWLDYYQVEIEADGFLAHDVGDLTEHDDGKAHVLARPATLRGRAVDGDGKPAAGITVGVGGPNARTGDDGTFEFEDLAPDPYRLAALWPYGGARVEVTLRDGETHDVELFVQRPARLRWRAVDADGKPVAATVIEARWRELEARADNEGRQVAEIAPDSPYSVRIEADGFQPCAIDVAATGPGGLRDLGDVVLTRTAMVEVVVLLPDGLRAPQGKVGDQAIQDGSATVPQGPATVLVPGYLKAYVDAQPPGPATVTLAEPRRLSGVVLSPEGEPVANQPVKAGDATAQTDAKGHFRLAPLPDGPVTVSAAHPPWAKIEMQVTPGEGELVLRFEAGTGQRLLRGFVRDGELPVRRFSVNDTDFVDEDGAFELLVDPRPVSVWIDDVGSFVFPLPPPGEPLIARLPGGAARVALEGCAAGVTVFLRTLIGQPLDIAETDAEGIATFRWLRPGRCIAVADDHRPAEVEVVAGEAPLVTLAAQPAGRLRVRLPGGAEETVNADPIDHIARVGAGPARVEARVEPGAELVVDLAPPDAGRLDVRGARDFRLVGRVGGARVNWHSHRPLDPLPSGHYALDAGLVHREVDVGPGESVEIDLEPGAFSVAGRVLRLDEAPAQGAMVMLAREGGWDFRLPVNPRGEFRFPEVPEGEFECWAELGNLRSARARVVVGPEGVTAEGLPLLLRPPSGDQIRLVAPDGTPLPGARVRIDGRWATTDREGSVALPGSEAMLDLDLPGFGAIRRLPVSDGQVVEVVRGATLVVLFDVPRERVEVRIDGRPWAPLEPDPLPRPEAAGRLRLEGLPAGEVEIEILPDPAEAPVPTEEESGDEAETPPPEPEITRVRLRPGLVTTVDLSD